MENILFFDCAYSSIPGSFSCGKLNNGRYSSERWILCRDVWHIDFSYKLCKLFFFSVPTDQTENLSKFITLLENILKIGDKTEISQTQRMNVCWIKPSKWWFSSAMRRSLFTLVLRAGCWYNGDNFWDAMFCYKHLKDTKESLLYFLEGYTKYTGRVSGWVNQFKDIDLLSLRKLLVQDDCCKKIRDRKA